MEENRRIFSVMISEEEKIERILNNFLKMLSNRIYIRNGEKRKLLNLDNARERVEDKGEQTFIITTNNKKTYSLKIILQKITSVSKNSPISEYLTAYEDTVKTIVASSYNKKIIDHALKNKSSIFTEADLLTDKLEYCDQPQFEILSPQEKTQYFEEYNTSAYTTKKILRTDPIVKYFAVKRGTVFRIIRPSSTSGEAVDYRIVH
jgi:DNA-directed RNA polymerase subunit H (RpoH/RPB5)